MKNSRFVHEIFQICSQNILDLFSVQNKQKSVHRSDKIYLCETQQRVRLCTDPDKVFIQTKNFLCLSILTLGNGNGL